MTKEKYTIKELEKDASEEFRLTVDGKLTKGHWINKGRAQPTGDGYKFTLYRYNPFLKGDQPKMNNGFYYLQNHDYGWQQQVELKDGDTVYDTVVNNAQGYDFEKSPFMDADTALGAAIEWLKQREVERV